MPIDILQQAIYLYTEGKVKEALRLIYPTPDSSLDSLDKDNSLLSPLVNVFDSLCFSSPQQALNAIDQLQKNAQQVPLEIPPVFLHSLKLDHLLITSTHLDEEKFQFYRHQAEFLHLHPLLRKILTCERQFIILSSEEFYSDLEKIPKEHRQYIEVLYRYSRNWIRFCLNKKPLIDLWNRLYNYGLKPLLARSHIPISYEGKSAFPEISSSRPSLISLLPFDQNWSSLLEKLKDQPTVFVFPSRYEFLHCLQFDELSSLLCSPIHHIFLLDAHLKEQKILQEKSSYIEGPIEVFNPSTLPISENLASQICTLYQKKLQPNLDKLYGQLYKEGKHEAYHRDIRRLGGQRYFAVRELQREMELYDRFSPLLLKEEHLSPDTPRYMKKRLKKISRRPIRSLKNTPPLRIAHITPQIIDGNHSPSLLLRALVEFYDDKQFKPFIYGTERLAKRLQHYPVNNRLTSPSSTIRGKKCIEMWRNQGIPVWVDPGTLSFEEAAELLCRQLKEDGIDIALFQGIDPINYLATSLTETPYRFFFECGITPEYSGFDLLILSTQESVENRSSFFQSIGSQAVGIPFALDTTLSWEDTPYPKSYFGLPEEARLLTTISNHLHQRLTSDVCLAISSILERFPEAYYLPMGPLDSPEELYQRFEKKEVRERIRPLGLVSNPSQLARSMDLYLNEFPIGSCFGMLDAMAAGCPTITMYDPQGPSAAHYGGSYFGIDRVIKTNCVEDYVELACTLLGDAEMYEEWSLYAKERYRQLSDPKGYVKKVETAMLNYIEHH